MIMINAFKSLVHIQWWHQQTGKLSHTSKLEVQSAAKLWIAILAVTNCRCIAKKLQKNAKCPYYHSLPNGIFSSIEHVEPLKKYLCKMLIDFWCLKVHYRILLPILGDAHCTSHTKSASWLSENNLNTVVPASWLGNTMITWLTSTYDDSWLVQSY